MSKKHSTGSIIRGLLAIGLLVLAVAVFLNRAFLIDQFTVWQFKPSAEVASFVTRTSMTEGAKFIFYAGEPRVEDAEEFNQNCDRKEQNVAVLGCYEGDIHIYNVTDARLDGIKEVTAAHEMLHAAYDRLSDNERNHVNELIEAEYAKLSHDAKLAERMRFYARTEPGERDNELHSVIGTEVKNVSPELETYFKKYFKDRSKVVALHDAYNNQFTVLSERADLIADEMKRLKTEITQLTREYNSAVTQLNSDVQAFNRRAEAGDFESQSEFNAARSKLEQRSVALESKRALVNAKIVAFNKYRDELQSISAQNEQLNQSIDSSLEPAPSL